MVGVGKHLVIKAEAQEKCAFIRAVIETGKLKDGVKSDITWAGELCR